jgi:hypothetical protein
MSIDELLFRQSYVARKGHWLHLNAVIKEYGYSQGQLYEYLRVNDIVCSIPDQLNMSSIYFHEDWLKLVKSGEGLAEICLVQSQVQDDRYDLPAIESRNSYKQKSRWKASVKQIQFLKSLSNSEYLFPVESNLLTAVLDEGYLSKARVTLLINYLIGDSFMWADGSVSKSYGGIISIRKPKKYMSKKQTV